MDDVTNDMTLTNICVVDDGTPDKVIECTCPMCNEDLRYRFSMDAFRYYGEDATLMVTEAWEQEVCGIDH